MRCQILQNMAVYGSFLLYLGGGCFVVAGGGKFGEGGQAGGQGDVFQCLDEGVKVFGGVGVGA